MISMIIVIQMPTIFQLVLDTWDDTYFYIGQFTVVLEVITCYIQDA